MTMDKKMMIKTFSTIIPAIVTLIVIGGCSIFKQQSADNIQYNQPGITENSVRPERLFLQQISSSSAIVKWRGMALQACISKTGLDLKTQAHCLPASSSDSNHKEAHFVNLPAETNFNYSVGGFNVPAMAFHTAPVIGQQPEDGNVHIWIIGDSGTGTYKHADGTFSHAGKAQAVMDGFLQYNASNGNEPLDLMLMLGDNAYENGTDDEWQGAFFDLYTDLISQTVVWPTIGNHEMGGANIESPEYGVNFYAGASTSSNPDSYISTADQIPHRIPYLDIFSLPTRGELGGVPSGTEQYYSFNYGNVHIISLDSQLSTRDEILRRAMKEWLVADLSANSQDWTIVIFHHPPYTKGSHDSDVKPSSYYGIDLPIIDIRQEFTPVFEDYGVDLVYSGHSHAYERSYYLNGHRGDANTFDAAKHAELNTDGIPASGYGDEAYSQISTGSKLDDKVVYTVAGSSGYVSLGKGKLDHPAHIVQKNDIEQRRGLAELGSVVLNAGSTKLTAHFINDKGQVLDTIIIQR